MQFVLKAVQDLWDELNEAAAEADAELEELAGAEMGGEDEADEGGKGRRRRGSS